MRNLPLRTAVLILAACLMLGCLPGAASAGNPEGLAYQNTHVNTGSQRADILAVAMSQLGYTELYENDTKFGDWGGYPYQPWCATFISWCARQAEISTEILKHSARANPKSFGIPYYHGSSYTPQPGDLFFTSGFEHVGLVYQVEGDYFIAIEGNAKEYDPDIPPDPDEDSYFVMTNRRRISDHYFGVPNYEGTDKAHTYVRGEDSGHPHKEYFACTICGHRYDTGYTAVHSDCAQCMSCGCKASGAGWYMVCNYHDPVRIRTGHSASADYIGYATQGEVVYVYGTSNGWAYIDFDGKRGHIKTQYLKKYHDIPDSPQLSVQTEYLSGEDVTVAWDAPANTEQYRLKLLRSGSLYREQVMDLSRTYTITGLPAGEYEVQVVAVNRAGLSQAGTAKFTVRDVYTLTYDPGGGVCPPPSQTQAVGTAAVITGWMPVRLGYTCLGWTDEGGRLYMAGDEITAHNHITLYPVWLENQTVEITPEPEEHVHSWGGYVHADAESHQRTCSCGETESELHCWDDGRVTRFPTCAETGLMEYTCTVCQTRREEILAVLDGHSWGLWNETDADSHSRVCDLCGKMETDCHNWDAGSVTRFPICAETGLREYACTVCQTRREEILPVTGEHSWSLWNEEDSLSHSRVCVRCGLDDTGFHRMEAGWSWDEDGHFRRCMDCGSCQDWENHIPVLGGSLTDFRPCGVCGAQLPPAVTYEQITRYAQASPVWMVGISQTLHLAGVLLG